MANRTSKIQGLSQNAVWHVPSKENPTDLISREISVEDWKHNELWWYRPKRLTTSEWHQRKEIETDTSKMKASAILVNTSTTYDVLGRFSLFEKLQRIKAYMLRFKTNSLGEKRKGPVSVKELTKAERSIMKLTQQETFKPDLRALQHHRQISKGSKLAGLNPSLVPKMDSFVWVVDYHEQTFQKQKDIR